ncbi:YkgJ family cysteine cluster protein [Psychrobium sp. 1_MG-2023]|uniref:YkgJ family cysteine cluster protein n=1 Tax=Psychrobium sp. 1_MG-2023 TaxID=3062624 RepID=UPI000C32E7B5|nr:YkgJ family cysteine cluster protein [Psychrobium sp. 1_MG-2023]MDP2561062.1 YkgJ family cysteine cluster protein [Psychrobium sp. 1_MG-2023]PKF58353.1 hypothetical protein CW748_04110 [Alteromonadales bacterium alter-6D02]
MKVVTLQNYNEKISAIECRLGCGACCIAPSISSSIPGMPKGKPAGVRCIQLDANNLCKIFGQPERPAVCTEFKADPFICGNSNESALAVLTELEAITIE